LLDRAWASKGKKKTNAVVIVAPGGVGKTSLVQRWRQQFAADGYRQAQRVFDWSFYSQGTRETEASADAFFDEALRWFGEPDPAQIRDPWQKGEQLANRVRQARTLLVLDGLEPMQYPPSDYEGQLKDHGLRALVTSLAEQNPGLLILTSREQVRELAGQEVPAVARIDLSELEPVAGAALLRAYGVQGEQEELEEASKEFDGHALALVPWAASWPNAARAKSSGATISWKNCWKEISPLPDMLAGWFVRTRSGLSMKAIMPRWRFSGCWASSTGPRSGRRSKH